MFTRIQCFIRLAHCAFEVSFSIKFALRIVFNFILYCVIYIDINIILLLLCFKLLNANASSKIFDGFLFDRCNKKKKNDTKLSSFGLIFLHSENT